MVPSSTKRTGFWPTVLSVGLLAGALDISCALVSYSIKTHKDPVRVFYFIASALFGKEAYDGGITMIIIGALMHFLIAAAFTIFFFLIYPRLSFLSRSVLLTAILYGVFVWAIMNLVMLPLLHTATPVKTQDILLGMAILIVAIGLPLSYFAKKFYK
jgi:hypothetical protein